MTSRMGAPRGLGSWLPLLLGLAGLLAALVSAVSPAAAAPVPSLVVEDGSDALLQDQEIVVDGSLGGPHAGQVFVANASRLTLQNVTLRFVNATAAGGIEVAANGVLVLDHVRTDSDASSQVVLRASGGASVTITASNLSNFQVPADLTAPGMTLTGGATLDVDGSTLRALPDLRLLLDASSSTVFVRNSLLRGAIAVSLTTLTLEAVVLKALGDAAAVTASGSSVTLANSTIEATGGGSGVSASDTSQLAVRLSNITAEDLAVSVVGSSSADLDRVIIVGASFGVVADATAVVTARNVGIYGTSTSIWMRNSQGNFADCQIGSGIVRAAGGQLELDRAGPLTGFVVLESSALLTVTDTDFNWSKISVASGSRVVPRWRPVFQFFYAGGSGPAGDVNFTVSAASTGSMLASGSSGWDGTAMGPPMEGPSFNGTHFFRPPMYRIEFGRGAEMIQSFLTAWGGGTFPFYLEPSAPNVAFDGDSLSLSDPTPGVGSLANISAILRFGSGGGPLSVAVVLRVDGQERGRRTVQLGVSPENISFPFDVEVGTHLVALEADFPPAGGRGDILESNERADNAVAIWFNASTNAIVSIKPDLMVDAVWFDYVPTVVADIVTGEPRDAILIVAHVRVLNQGLTASGPFDVSIAAGFNTTRIRFPGIAPGGTAEQNASFGPYDLAQMIPVRVQVDVENRVSEGDETNNVRTTQAIVELAPMPGPPRPTWVTALILSASVGIVALALWGFRLIWKEEGEEDVSPVLSEQALAAGSKGPTARVPAAAPPVAPPAAPPTGPPPAPQAPAMAPPGVVGYPPAPVYYYPPPVGYPPAVGYPPMRFVSVAPPVPAGPPPPPARCPKCGSSQVSYVLYPVRQVVCSNCKTNSLF